MSLLHDYLMAFRLFSRRPGADEKGFSTGDRVHTINGRTAVDYDAWELRPLMRREGEKIVLTASRGDNEYEVVLVLGRLI